jgi:O-antigen ligase
VAHFAARATPLWPATAAAMAGMTSLGVGTLLAEGVSTFRLIVLTAALALLPVVAVRPELLGAFFLGMLWARVSDVGISEHGLPSLAVPCAVALLGLSVGRRLVAGERIGPATFQRVFPLLPYFAVVSLSALWATAPDRSLSSAGDLAKNLLICWVLIELMSSLNPLVAGCLALVLVSGALSLLSVYQYVTGTFTSDYGGFAQAEVRQIMDSENLYRLAGPIGDPNFFALILLVTVPVGLALLGSRLHLLVRLAVAVSIILTSAAVLLTYSRGGTLVLAIGCLLALVHFRVHLPRLALLLLAVPVAVAFAPSSVWDRMGTVLRPFQDAAPVGQVVDTAVDLRLGAQQVALEMFLDHPFGGVGSGNYPLLYQDYSQRLGVTAVASEFHPHSLYLEVAAETGAIGLLAFMPAVIGPLVALERTRRTAGTGVGEAREWYELAFGIELALASYLAASLLLHGSYPRYMWVLLALAVAARHVARGQPARR